MGAAYFVYNRLRTKVRQVLPILVSAGVVYLLTLVLLKASEPLFPQWYHELYNLIDHASWPESGQRLAATVRELGAWGPVAYMGTQCPCRS